MNKVRTVAAALLAIPLIAFGGSYFIHPLALPPIAGSPPGVALLQAMRAGGLMYAIAFSHLVAGMFLLVRRTRFLAALLQFPMTIGILAFHLTMWLEATPPAVVLLLLNLLALADPTRLRSLVRSTRSAKEE